MTSSPPDIASLTLHSRASQQRLHDSYDYEGESLNRQFHFATAQGPYAKPKPAARGALPTVSGELAARHPLTAVQQWLDSNSSDSRSLSPHNNSYFSSAGGSPPLAHLNPPINPDDEVIPTAIVIKNIPFNVKRETLLDIIVSLFSPPHRPILTLFPPRLLSLFPPPMPSTTISTSRAPSAASPLPTSANLSTQTRSSLPSTASMFRGASCVSSTKRSSRQAKRSA